MDTAIIYLTHTFIPKVLQPLEKLRQQTHPYGDFYILNDGNASPPKSLRNRLHVFHFSNILKKYPRVMGDTLIPGNPHLAILDFFRAHPNYKYYWIIEYDVRFSGDWSLLFEAFSKSDADLLTCHVRTYNQEPDWPWWINVKIPDPTVTKDQWVRAFLPIQRLSHRALVEIERCCKEGWYGHFEATLPTMLHHAGLKLEDIGGDGDFVRPGNINRFYTSVSTPIGDLRWKGSFRFRPPHSFWPQRSNTLYHPVKPSPSPLWQFLRNIASAAVFRPWWRT